MNNSAEKVAREVNPSAKAQGAIDSIKDVGQQAYSQVTEELLPAAKEKWSNVEKSATELMKQGTQAIKKHPFQAVLIGVGIGALVGTLFRMRKAKA